MGILKLVLVDRDADYVHSLLDYLISQHRHRFQISYYTEEAAIDHFLKEEENTKSFDLIVSGSEFYETIKAQRQDQGVVILLADQQDLLKYPLARSVKKYQYGDSFVTEIMQILAEESTTSFSPVKIQEHSSKTKVIGIYSPVGGVGKTTIAIGACVQSAWEGKKVFYLNLENAATTPLYFRGQQEKNLANVLYYLQSNTKNLSLQIEAAKCADPLYQIEYFQPPDSIIDFNEDISQELCLLLKELKASQQYERIFLDFSTEINKNNLTLWQACDALVLVAKKDLTSLIKLKSLEKELRLLHSKAEGLELLAKFNLVINKATPDVMNMTKEFNLPELNFNKKGIVARIPLVENLVTVQNGVYLLDLNSAFGKAIHQLLRNF